MTQKQQQSEAGSTGKSTRLSATVFVCLLLSLPFCFVDSLSDGMISELTTGWASFSARVLPAMTIRWDSLLVFFTGILIAAVSLHTLVTWLLRERRGNQRNEVTRKGPWSFSSSVATTAMILLVFAVGISMTGIVHQTGWILTGTESIAVSVEQTAIDAELSRYKPDQEMRGESWIAAVSVFALYEVPGKPSRNESFNSVSNASEFRNKLMPLTLCPSQYYPAISRDGFGLSHVVANPEILGKQWKDIEGATLLGGEINAGFDPWAAPLNIRSPTLGISENWVGPTPEKVGYGSQHRGGVNIMRVDGSVDYLSENVAPEVLRRFSGSMAPEF